MNDSGDSTQHPGARGMAVSLLAYANRAKVAEALTEQGYEVSRMTVNRWAAGSEMPEIAARLIARLFGHEPDTAIEPPPWAEALADRTARQVISALVAPEVLAAMPDAIAALEAPQPRGDDSPLEGWRSTRSGRTRAMSPRSWMACFPSKAGSTGCMDPSKGTSPAITTVTGRL